MKIFLYKFRAIAVLLLILSIGGCSDTRISARNDTEDIVDYSAAHLELSELPSVDDLPKIDNIIKGELIVGKNIELAGINWLVLDKQDDKVLLLSDRILEHRAYHEYWEYVRWETSSLREYLNGEFITNTFDEQEQSRILETIVVNDSNPWYMTDGGNDTIDKVFLLSLNEVIKYFGDSGQLVDRPLDEGQFGFSSGSKYVCCIHDQFDMKRMAYDLKGITSVWWLRTPGFPDHSEGFSFASCIDGGELPGYIFLTGSPACTNSEYVSGYYEYDSAGVRPALWFDLRE